MFRVCVGCVSAMCQVCVSQPEIKNPRPARNAKSATSPKSRWDSPPPRHPCCEKWCGAHFFHDASDEKPVSPCVARVIKFHFRRCSIRKACVGDPTYLLCFNLLLSLFCEKHGAKCLCQFANGRLLCFNLPTCT